MKISSSASVCKQVPIPYLLAGEENNKTNTAN